MENNLPLGTPKYNQDLTCFNLDCTEDIQISCNENDCRLIDIKKNGALILTLLAASVLVCVKNDDSDCAPCLVKDYRQANNSAPYVKLQGYSSECESKFFKIETLSIFPKQGQDVAALRTEIIEAVCSCLNSGAGTAAFDNGIEFNDTAQKYGLGGTFDRNTKIAGNDKIWAIGYDSNFVESRLSAFTVATAGDLTLNTNSNIFAIADKISLISDKIQIQLSAFQYWGNPDSPLEGDWRFGLNGTDFIHQRYESGLWITKQTIAA
jgi:hypothetical protein